MVPPRAPGCQPPTRPSLAQLPPLSASPATCGGWWHLHPPKQARSPVSFSTLPLAQRRHFSRSPVSGPCLCHLLTPLDSVPLAPSPTVSGPLRFYLPCSRRLLTGFLPPVSPTRIQLSVAVKVTTGNMSFRAGPSSKSPHPPPRAGTWDGAEALRTQPCSPPSPPLPVLSSRPAAAAPGWLEVCRDAMNSGPCACPALLRFSPLLGTLLLILRDQGNCPQLRPAFRHKVTPSARGPTPHGSHSCFKSHHCMLQIIGNTDCFPC